MKWLVIWVVKKTSDTPLDIRFISKSKKIYIDVFTKTELSIEKKPNFYFSKN